MRFWILALSLLGFFVSADTARAERRVAFVVGNGTYRNATPLPNPPIDARSMASLLRNAGFDVVEGINLTRDEMTGRLLEFGQKTQSADIAVFFYAGHGIAVDGVNYLLPVDADIKSEMDVKPGNAINVGLALDQTMNAAKVKLVFLDACRDNPFAAKIRAGTGTRRVSVRAGLAEMSSGEGTLIAYATGPGQTALDGPAGTNSPFTRALIANIARPGVELQQAMTQVRAEVNEETHKAQLPWGQTNLTGAVYLNPAAAPAVTAAVVAANSPPSRASAASPARVAALENGPSTTTRNLSAPVDPTTSTDEATQQTEDQIGLDKRKRRDVQRRLTRLGFDARVNGKFDEATRAVITRWQAARGYPKTGFLNAAQHQALLNETAPAAHATAGTGDETDDGHPPHRRGRRAGGGPNPVRMIGGMIGGLFGR